MNDDFIWQNYIDLDCYDCDFQQDIETVLDEMTQTPEGRALIEKACDLNDNVRVKLYGIRDGISCALPDKGVMLARSEIACGEYLDAEEKAHDFSLPRVIFHELFHMTDEEYIGLYNAPREVREAAVAQWREPSLLKP